MANLAYYNFMCPMGVWSNLVPYSAQTIYNEFGTNMVQCPTISYNSHVYVANGYTTGGTALQPTLGLAPNTDAAWQLYI